jgi:hypothetical protein
MAETNGSGRLDRVESILASLAERLASLAERQREFAVIQERDHEEFARDHKQLITWQVLMREKMDRSDEDRDRKRLDQLWEKTDQRIAELVSAIGALIAARSAS